MSLMDTIKEKLGMSKDKASDAMRQHGDKVEQGIDKAGRTIDSKTGGKHSDQVGKGTAKAKDAAHDYGEGGGKGNAS
jgi:hypothetical protein